MFTTLGTEIKTTLQNLKEMANDEVLAKEHKAQASKALDKLNFIFNEMLSTNELLKSKIQEEEAEEHPAIAEVPKRMPLKLVDKKDNYLKVKFLLLKCKELHGLLQKYDTPTPGLLEKKKNYRLEIAKTLRPFHNIARKLCTDGVIEDLSTMLVRIAAVPFSSQVDAIKAIAHYITNRRSNSPEKSPRFLRPHSAEVPSSSAPKPKDPLIRVDLRVASMFKRSINPCITGKSKLKRKGHSQKSDTTNGSSQLELKDDNNREGIPKEILTALYRNQTKAVAEAVTKLATAKPIDKRSRSCTNFIRNLNAGEDVNLLTKSEIKWAEEVLCDDKKQRPSCVEPKVTSSFTGPEVQAFSTRILTPRFPKLKGRNDFFAEVQPPKLDSKPHVRRYDMSAKVESVRSNTSMFYAKQKRLANQSEPKSESETDEDGDDGADVLSQHLFKEQDSEHIKRDEEIKKYIDKIIYLRNESMERYGYPKFSMGFKKDQSDSFQNSIRIRIAVPESNIIKEKLAKIDPDPRKTTARTKST